MVVRLEAGKVARRLKLLIKRQGWVRRLKLLIKRQGMVARRGC